MKAGRGGQKQSAPGKHPAGKVPAQSMVKKGGGKSSFKQTATSNAWGNKNKKA